MAMLPSTAAKPACFAPVDIHRPLVSVMYNYSVGVFRCQLQFARIVCMKWKHLFEILELILRNTWGRWRSGL